MNYYDDNAEKFFENTVNADMTPHYTKFLKHIPEKGHILDAGCGSGRDTLNFLKQGYKVTAIDASEEMCKLASKYTQQEVLHQKFQEINFIEEFDGIWASASLLHVPSTELEYVLDKFRKSLKENGVLYASFKCGIFEGRRNGRYFNDFTETAAKKIFEKNNFNIIDSWLTNDVRDDRKNEKWVNILVKA